MIRQSVFVIAAVIFLKAASLPAKVLSLDYQVIGQTALETGYLPWTNSYITYLKDVFGNEYLIKQISAQQKIERWAKIVCEVVALEIGHSIGVSQNVVCVIPAGVPFIGKDTAVPVTLHTLVPGIRFDKYKHQGFPDLVLRQRDERGKAVGLTREVLYHMSQHRDLPALVALDTFVGNPARHKHNFFYDPLTDRFYGIDMGASFHKDLCGKSKKTLQTIMEHGESFSQKELAALRAYTDILHTLVRKHTPKKICKKLQFYAEYAGLYNDQYFDRITQDQCSAYLINCKKNIYKGYYNALLLLEELEKFLALQQKD